MSKNCVCQLLLVALSTAADTSAAEGVLVIGHPGLRPLDVQTITRIYTGRTIEVNGIPVTAVNAASGTIIRRQFLQIFLGQDEDKYTAYWTVRRYNGLGASPRELAQSTDVIKFVNSTPGGIGYIYEADYQPGLNILFR
jgi:hypothetical protein